MREYLERALRTAAAVVAAMVCIVSPAKAAFYSGAWDPTYGMPFIGGSSPLGYDLGWRGTVEVVVPDSCAFLPGPRSYGAGSPCALGSFVQSASVELYDVNDPFLATKGTVTFSTSSMSIRGLNFVDDDLISLSTLPSSWEQAAWITPLPPASPFFSLLFVDEGASNFLRAPFGSVLLGQLLGFRDEIPEDYFGPLLLSHPDTDFDDPVESLAELVTRLIALGGVSVSDVESEAGRPRYPNGSLFAAPPAEIPEPGSLALVALALFATAWGARRRRRI